jgi:hypothetical protein
MPETYGEKMNYYIASLLIACIGPSTYSVNIPGVIIGFWAWGIIVMGIAYVNDRERAL